MTLDFSTKDRFWGRLPREAAETLLTHGVECQFGFSDLLMREGDSADCVFVLLEGEVEIVKGGIVIDRQRKEGVLGEMGVITGMPRSTTVRASSAVRALRIPGASFLSVFDEHPRALREVCRELSEKLLGSQTLRHGQQVKLMQVLETFEKCVSPSFLDRIMNSSSPAELLEGSMAEASILFFDIRGFSAACEVMKPKHLLEVINRHLEVMVDSVLEHGGVINNFIGDAVMAVFNCPIPSPDSAGQALRCALDCERRLGGLPIGMDQAQQVTFSFGAGLNFGPVVAGAIGSRSRFNYTVLGDAVNLAARLEGLTRHYPLTLIASEDFFGQLEPDERGDCLHIDRVAVKGRKAPLDLYTCVDWPGQLREDYGWARDMYLRGDFSGASELFRQHPLPLFRVMDERCKNLRLVSHGEWPGFFVWDRK